MKKLTLFFLLLATSAWALPTQKINVTGSAGLNVLKAGDTMTGPLINSSNGAASTPALHFTGTPYDVGTTTTNKALVLIEPTGATSTAWHVDGTFLGINSAAGFAGDLLKIMVNNTSALTVGPSGLVSGSSGSFSSFTANGINSTANNNTLAIGSARTYSTAGKTQIQMLSGQSDTSTSGTAIGVSILPTYNQVASTSSNTDLYINRTETSVGSGTQYLINAAVGGTTKFNVNNAGKVTAIGGIRIDTSASKPTCDSAARGLFWHTQGAAGVKDAVEVCAKDAGDAYAWRTIY